MKIFSLIAMIVLLLGSMPRTAYCQKKESALIPAPVSLFYQKGSFSF